VSQQNGCYTSARRVFGVLFVLSICVLVFLLVRHLSGKESSSGMHPAGSVELENRILGIISLLTSVASLIGFASTTYLQWRQERRRVKATDLERQRQELEVEKLRLELKRMKAEDGSD
jgi:hypothetical protein